MICARLGALKAPLGELKAESRRGRPTGRRGGAWRLARWLALGVVSWMAACGGHAGLRDPLAESDGARNAARRRDVEIDLPAMAARQLELAAAATEIEAGFSALSASGGWRERGYFTAAEHEAIEWWIFRFVHTHRALWAETDRLGGVELAWTEEADRPLAHLLALHAGLVLAEASSFLVVEFQEDPVAIAKLNEAFYRSEIPADTYEKLRLATTRRERGEALAKAWSMHQKDMKESEKAGAKVDPALAPIVAALPPLWARLETQTSALVADRNRIAAAIDHDVVGDAARASARSLGAAGYETRALIFKNVSRIKNPDAHLIRFSEAQKRELHGLLQPGDVILTYTAGYVSDVFIPGAFKHGITYVGVGEDRTAAGLSAASAPMLDRPRIDRFAADLERDRMPDGSRADLIEAVAEGVQFSNLDRILDTHVNRLLVLRPQIEEDERTAFLAGVFSFLGDPYDFRFDFADASRQVCTEVIYRALNGKSAIAFALTPRGGHPTLSADDVVTYHFATPGRFEVIAFAEEDPDGRDHAAALWIREPAEQRLKARMASP